MNAHQNLPPGVTEQDLAGDRHPKYYTVILRFHVCVEAHDDDEAIEAAHDAVAQGSFDQVKEAIIDCEPV